MVLNMRGLRRSRMVAFGGLWCCFCAAEKTVDVSRSTWDSLMRSSSEAIYGTDDELASEMLSVWSAADTGDGQKQAHPWLLQCVGGADPTCIDHISAATGSSHVRPVGTSGYYSVSMNASTAEALSGQNWVGSVAPFTPRLKLEFGLYEKWQAAEQGEGLASVWGAGSVAISIAIETISHDDAVALFKAWETQLAAQGFSVTLLEKSHTRPTTTIKFRETAVATISKPSDVRGAVDFLSLQPQVHWLEQRPTYRTHNAWTKGIMQSADYTSTPLYDEGITGSTQTFGISDTGIDLTSCFFAQSCAAPYDLLDTSCSKVIYYDCYVDCTDYEEGHGTHVVGSAVGLSNDTYTDYDGLAYNSKVAFMDIGDSEGTLTIPADIGTDLLGLLYDEGARVHSISWGGSDTSSTYTMDSLGVDRFMYENSDAVVAIAAGNYGPGSETVISPSTAKNCITVGASVSDAAMWSTVGNYDTDLYNEYNAAYFTSWGPTSDGRMKPDVMAPGYITWSAYSAGTDSTSEHCSVVYKSGTSMATPLVSAAAALTREYFESGYYPTGSVVSSDAFTPSGSLLKAMLINSAQELLYLLYENDTEASMDWPGNVQGYGRVDLEQALYFSSGSTVVSLLQVYGASDSTATQYVSLAATGDADTYTFESTSSEVGGQLKVTLVWTDPPATAGSSSVLVNDLDLSVTDPDGTSLSVQNTDNLNNVEQVYVSTPSNGTYTVTVTASTLSYTQPYALVITVAELSTVDISATDYRTGVWWELWSFFDSWDALGWVILYWVLAILLATYAAMHYYRKRKPLASWASVRPQVVAGPNRRRSSDSQDPSVGYVALAPSGEQDVARRFAELAQGPTGGGSGNLEASSRYRTSTGAVRQDTGLVTQL